MPLEPVKQVTGRAVFIPGADIDTDRIIPARFMKCVTFDGLGEFAFYDVRFNPDTGEKTDHPLNDERFSGNTASTASSPSPSRKSSSETPPRSPCPA
jgi:3-isopropylmalate/(R)-2-methylmalate dehydratase small subunit